MKHSILCLSSALIALIGSVYNSSAMALDPPSHDTLAYTQELKPMPQAYQLARATFLPEAAKTDFKFSGNTTEGDYNQATSCEDKSKLYTTANCTYPRAVVAASRCPFLAGYYTECKCLSQFNKTSCTSPYVLGGTSCDGKYEKCVCPATVSLTYANDKCTQYCDGNCIKKSCTVEPNQTNCTNGTQNCDDKCGGTTRKCCVACANKTTSKPANSSYTYSSCTDGSGTKQIQTGWKCNPGYHEKKGGCEKDCIATTCSGYPLSACPANANCSSCSKQTTTCGGGDTMFRMIGCQSRFHQSGNTCVAHSYSCPSGSQASACSSSQVQTGTTPMRCSCGATSGICFVCRTKTCEEQGKKTCNGSCIATYQCCGGCPSGKKCSNGTCIAEITEGTITVYHHLNSDAVMESGPWLNPNYKEPGSSTYNVYFPRAEVVYGPTKMNKTTSRKVKLGGELRISLIPAYAPDLYKFSHAHPYPKSLESYPNGDYGYIFFDVTSSNTEFHIYYEKK